MLKTAIVHDSGWSGDDLPYSVREMGGFGRIFTRGFESFAQARRWAIDAGLSLWSEEFFVWG